MELRITDLAPRNIRAGGTARTLPSGKHTLRRVGRSGRKVASPGAGGLYYSPRKRLIAAGNSVTRAPGVPIVRLSFGSIPLCPRLFSRTTLHWRKTLLSGVSGSMKSPDFILPNAHLQVPTTPQLG